MNTFESSCEVWTLFGLEMKHFSLISRLKQEAMLSPERVFQDLTAGEPAGSPAVKSVSVGQESRWVTI